MKEIFPFNIRPIQLSGDDVHGTQYRIVRGEMAGSRRGEGGRKG